MRCGFDDIAGCEKQRRSLVIQNLPNLTQISRHDGFTQAHVLKQLCWRAEEGRAVRVRNVRGDADVAAREELERPSPLDYAGNEAPPAEAPRGHVGANSRKGVAAADEQPAGVGHGVSQRWQ